MTLVNFTKKHRRRNGGIRLLGLIDQREVVSATYSELDKGFTELTLDEGASLSNSSFWKTEPNTAKRSRQRTALRP